MNDPQRCRTIVERLDRYLAGDLAESERGQLERHLEGCDACSELHATRAVQLEAGVGPPADLVEAVLVRTSGPACRSSHDRLADWTDGMLAPADAALMRSHLERCDPCNALARTMARMSGELPLLAELEPGPGFAELVLERTSLTRATPTASSGTERWAAYWGELFRRPRFALEASYVGAIGLFLVFGTSASPLAGVPRRVIELATVNPVAELREPGARLQSRVSARVEAAWQSTRTQLVSASREAAGEATALSGQALNRLERDLGTLWQRVASEQENDTTESHPPERETTRESQQGDRP